MNASRGDGSSEKYSTFLVWGQAHLYPVVDLLGAVRRLSLLPKAPKLPHMNKIPE